MDPTAMRVALFAGNYNYVRDGATQTLNRLVEYLLRKGVAVRIYSPVVKAPAFEPQGEMVHVPALRIPGRWEYRYPMGLPRRVRKDLEKFDPNVVHIASPDITAHRAVTWARKRDIARVASVHTRFETYFQYYHLGWAEPWARAGLRRLYQRCDALVAPAQSTVDVLYAQRMNDDISIWSRGIDREQFNPERRDMGWRRDLGIGDDEMVISFLGRIVMEKGLDVFADTIRALKDRDVPHRVLVIGDGPHRDWFEDALPDSAVFVGHQEGPDLARALASSDVFFNPSITETFGNVTLEAMACALPVVAISATGSSSLVQDGVNGQLARPGNVDTMADAIAAYQESPELRQRHGRKGLEMARDRDWDTINNAVLDVYARCIAKHRD
ncbi:glycosyltransferase family 4 protein [Sphingomicrobium clamense]|uniref:Glycosyltransferase family 1 protein n=1 Tax=Sphingomicrobium clamense TaxID=2851013 RepID=A0ABS6V989_9SPHN|nr:glycosyltransferase family 1 protein [Sphingomicrobium sp. B8]MBW0145643.1 glycosyltransferase family 1 protein [Sphingomicrobium sp. B8]